MIAELTADGCVFLSSADKPGSELRALCASLDGLAAVAPERLRLWLGKLVVSLGDRGDDTSAGRNERLESQQLLQSLTAYLVREDRSGRRGYRGGDLTAYLVREDRSGRRGYRGGDLTAYLVREDRSGRRGYRGGDLTAYLVRENRVRTLGGTGAGT